MRLNREDRVYGKRREGGTFGNRKARGYMQPKKSAGGIAREGAQRREGRGEGGGLPGLGPLGARQL